jgi:hypothetical protein
MIIIRNRQDFISAAASSIDDMTNVRERRVGKAVGKLNENYYRDSADSKVSSSDI